MQISVKNDIKQLTKDLNKVQSRQIPFAVSSALSTLAFDCRKTLQTILPDYIDKPTPFTTRSIQVKKATKKNLVAEVGFASKTFGRLPKNAGTVPADYMGLQITGGTRQPKKQSIPVPTKHLRTNKFGNIPKGRISKLLADRDKYFSGVPKGMDQSAAGIWQKMGKKRPGKIRMVVAWEPKADYQKRLPFKRVMEKTVKQNFRKRFDHSLRKALETAR